MIRLRVRLLLTVVATVSFAVTSTPGLNRVGTAAALQVDPPAAPVKVGSLSAGTYADATGHSAQSHLVYAANAGVWWLFTLTSAADTAGGTNHIVKAYRSSGADLASAVWTAAGDSPGASASAGFAPNGTMGGGRALGVAYVNNAPNDFIHAEVALAADGQDGITGHIRARLTATGITWESWNYKVEGAATWTLPRAVSLGLSNGKFIHSGGPTLQQEVDANARRSSNADTGAAWTSGFSTVVVIDNSMLHQCNALAFAPLAGETMLAVYDNGRGTEPGQTNLRYKRSNTNGTWTGVVVGSQLGGDGDVFGSTASIDQNDWALVALNPSTIRAYRRNAAGTGVDAAAYNTASNAWSAAPAPPAFGAGQAFKSGGGLFGANDGTATWLFAINTDAANTILFTRHDGTSWSSWAPVPGTNSGSHSRRSLSGQPVAAPGQVGLIWTEGTSSFDIFATALATAPPAPDTTAPTVTLLGPADGSTVFRTVSISASASDNRSVSSVQFRLDDANLGSPQTAPPYGLAWDSRTVGNGTHSIAAVATDGAGNAATASATVSVDNRPVISAVSATPLSTSSERITWTTDVAATSVVDFGETGAYGAAVSNPALVTSHQLTLSGLAAGTVYHYRATSADAAGNPASTGDLTFTTSAPDTTVPTVSITAPAGGAAVSGTAVTVSASASDNIGVAGVQFKLDGVNLGAEDTTSPYSITWNTTTAANGGHSVSAVARDAAGNTAAAAVSVTVSNNTDTTPPTVAARTPTANATGVSTATAVSATFSEAMNAATITGTTFSLRNASNALVTATVAYNAATLVATLTPSAALAAGQTYTATITGGSSGVRDAAGNPLAANSIWSFTTAASAPVPPGSSMTIWSASAAPASFATSDTSSVELGVKFRSDVAGTVVGVRFYKGTITTGTHTGTLWSSSGTKLATATFSGETASGWQQVNFATPIAIAANTVYVISYHTNVGRYAYTSAQFASAGVDNGPLHALRNGVSGGNGIYRYGAVAFPNSTFNSTNYWVDVVFVPQ
jgi:uncharacterized protein DUF4082/Big-like domain-containing protein